MPSNYDPFQVESSAYDPMMDDEDDGFDEEDDKDGLLGAYETIVCAEKEQEGAPWTLIDDADGVALWKEFDGGVRTPSLLSLCSRENRGSSLDLNCFFLLPFLYRANFLWTGMILREFS